MKTTSLLCAVLSATGLFAATSTVMSVTAQQRYPWNGEVDIVVTFAGASNDVATATAHLGAPWRMPADAEMSFSFRIASAAKDELAASGARSGRRDCPHGYVQDRGPGAGGPCYQWTRKVKAKTVSVALSKEQFEAMREAIANWKALKLKLARMEELSRTIIFGTEPDTFRFKRPKKTTIGLGRSPKSALLSTTNFHGV